MKSLWLSVLVSLIGASASAQLINDSGTLITVSVNRAYIPQGYDNNDTVKVAVEGQFPSTCYKLGKTLVDFNHETREVRISQQAYLYQQTCVMMIVPYFQTVDLGILQSAGQYNIFDASNKAHLGTLPVSASRTNGPDDHYYAMMTDAYLRPAIDNKKEIVLEGSIPNACWVLMKPQVLLDGKDVLTVLPIMQQKSKKDCDNKPIPFAITVPMPDLAKGRYLLNVRSLNGSSINKIIEESFF